ncbi:hypothetical protein VdG1_06684 [Verticillium dahliae VDG1]|nr:hypothetical protein VdG1_06684 [Verticillium dahliae VDG1]
MSTPYRATRLLTALARPARAAAPSLRTASRTATTRRTLTSFSSSSSRPSVLRKTGATTLPSQRRTIFIQTEPTPNPDALKFLPNHRVLPEGITVPYIEYLNPRATIAPPHPSPLAAQLLAIDGVTAVFYGADFITVTKAADANWAHAAPAEEDSLAYNEDDSEVVGMIKELLETRIRPAIQEDGGDIEFRGFEDGVVLLKLRGACRTCDSSTVTLKNGIEGMLMHYIEEVKSVNQVMDPEEDIALEEFAKFEEKLKAQKGEAATA